MSAITDAETIEVPAEAAKSAPTVPTLVERRQALHALVAQAMSTVKAIDAAAREGDVEKAVRLTHALATARSVLEEAAQ